MKKKGSKKGWKGKGKKTRSNSATMCLSTHPAPVSGNIVRILTQVNEGDIAFTIVGGRIFPVTQAQEVEVSVGEGTLTELDV